MWAHLWLTCPDKTAAGRGAYLQKNYDWRTAVSRCLCSHLQATVKLWVKRGMAHPLSQRIKRADDYSRLQCPKTGFQIDKARIQCSPHYGSITIEGNTIAFTELQSWSLCISSVELSNSSHFRHKPFLGKQSQKVLKSFWKGSHVIYHQNYLTAMFLCLKGLEKKQHLPGCKRRMVIRNNTKEEKMSPKRRLKSDTPTTGSLFSQPYCWGSGTIKLSFIFKRIQFF